MTRRTFFLLCLVACIAAALVWWLRRAPTDYTNYPPTAIGPWVASGDSLTEGVGASEGNDYPALLGKILGIQIVNRGRSGETTTDALVRLDEVAQLHPRVVLLCFGGNDVLSQTPRVQMLKNLETIIDRLQAEGSFVVLIGIRSASLRDRNETYFAELAKKKRTAYLPDMLREIAFKPVYMSDAVHPNDQGYQLIAERIAKFLKPYRDQL